MPTKSAPKPPPCRRCNFTGGDQYKFPESSKAYYSGEVYKIKESVWTPIEDILANASPGLERSNPSAVHRARESLHRLRTIAQATPKEHRPCILMTGLTHDGTGHLRPRVCLMATFEGTPMEDLPRIMAFFCIVVLPHIPYPSPETEHLHALPEWPGIGSWVIAWQYTPSRPLEGRWPLPEGCRDRAGMAFGSVAYDKLLVACQARKERWKECCKKNPNFAREYEQEYRLHLEKRQSLRSGSSAETRSQKSCERRESASPYKRTPHHRRQQSLAAHTIIEGEVASFHEQANTRLPDQPRESPRYTPQHYDSPSNDRYSASSSASGKRKNKLVGVGQRLSTAFRKSSHGRA